ncbi:unnamed protein product [Rodentolepis nana]|uniref:Uncharacterized protein n=1 Tax=Rodentolepis nana TaxID=102285 RepID=A0A0R3TI90_RODNA|nr:unnamed protein product [Rodentolepis nana]
MRCTGSSTPRRQGYTITLITIQTPVTRIQPHHAPRQKGHNAITYITIQTARARIQHHDGDDIMRSTGSSAPRRQGYAITHITIQTPVAQIHLHTDAGKHYFATPTPFAASSHISSASSFHLPPSTTEHQLGRESTTPLPPTAAKTK